jgi:hypothetical protein
VAGGQVQRLILSGETMGADYYGRHLQGRPGDAGYVNFALNYFDEDVAQEVHVLAFLHLLRVSDSQPPRLKRRRQATCMRPATGRHQ